MPLSHYFGGKGRRVMADMKSRYGDKKGESVFYATANARGQTPNEKNSSQENGQEAYNRNRREVAQTTATGTWTADQRDNTTGRAASERARGVERQQSAGRRGLSGRLVQYMRDRSGGGRFGSRA